MLRRAFINLKIIMQNQLIMVRLMKSNSLHSRNRLKLAVPASYHLLIHLSQLSLHHFYLVGK